MEPSLKQLGPLLDWLVSQILPLVQNYCLKQVNVQGGRGHLLEVHLGRQGMPTGSQALGMGLPRQNKIGNKIETMSGNLGGKKKMDEVRFSKPVSIPETHWFGA